MRNRSCPRREDEHRRGSGGDLSAYLLCPTDDKRVSKWINELLRAPSPGPITTTHNLQLHCLSLELNCPDLEVDANGADIALGVGVVCEPEEQAGLEWCAEESVLPSPPPPFATHLADARVSNKQKLEKVVVFACVHDGRCGREMAACGMNNEDDKTVSTRNAWH